MAFSPELLDKLQRLEPDAWTGIVYRHMVADYPPTLENIRGARWNPRGTPAIYASLDRETCLAEASYILSLQPLAARVKRTIYRIGVKLSSVLDLRDHSVLQDVAFPPEELESIEYRHCQEVGGAVAWLGSDGLLIPSARKRGGSNLVIFTASQTQDTDFEVIDSEEIARNP